jgi:hypothetical protein
MTETFVNLIVTQANHAAALAEAAVLAQDGMFTVGLSADGYEPATHWISTGLIDDAMLAALLPLCETSFDDPFAAMARAGLQLTTLGDRP